MDNVKHAWSRRDFLKGSVLGAGALGTSALLGGCAPKTGSSADAQSAGDLPITGGEGRTDANGVMLLEDWLGTAPEFADDEIDEVIDVDVVVVGGGVSGVAAARAAAEDGSTVAIFEKCDKFQARSGEFSVIGSKIAEEHWGRSNLDIKHEVLNQLMHDSFNRADARILNQWANHSGEALDWYIGAKEDITILPTSITMPPDGVTEWVQPRHLPMPEGYDQSSEYYKCYFTTTVQFAPNHDFVLQANAEKALATGNLTAYMKTAVKKLLREDGGRVTGVIAQEYGPDGKTYRVNAAKGVVLCAGDYSSDTNMLRYYNPWVRNNLEEWGSILYTSVDPEGNLSNTGDGHKMGMWIGAKMEEGPHSACTHSSNGAMGCTAFLEVDCHGRRIGNEDVDAQAIDNRVHSLYKNKMYQIWDSEWVNEVAHLSCSHVQITDICSQELHERNFWCQPNFGYATEDWAEQCVEDGRAIKADTLEELASMIEDFDDEARETFVKTVERYNASAEAGVDEEFGKRSDRLFALKNPPYYASPIKLEQIILVFSGLEVDEQFRVLDEEREVIPGLYAAGNNAGGRFAGVYPISSPGVSHGSALTFGMLAGHNAAAAI